jgi:hypothetical protein
MNHQFNSRDYPINSCPHSLNSRDHTMNSRDHPLYSREHQINSRDHQLIPRNLSVNSRETPVKFTLTTLKVSTRKIILFYVLKQIGLYFPHIKALVI